MSQFAFQYLALDQTGSRTRGVLQAANRKEACRQIAAAGMRPLKVTAARSRLFRGGGRVGLKDLSHFTYQLGVMMEARIPILEGLEGIAEQETNDRLRRIVNDIASEIAGGSTITDALIPHRHHFGEAYIETVRAAEASGNMTEILGHLAEMLERRYEARKTVRGALLYPACVMLALSAAVTVLMIFVVPRFAAMFESRGLDLPLMTKLLIGCSALLRTWWYAGLGIAVGGGIALRHAMTRDEVRRKVDRVLHRVPVLGSILTGVAVSRFARVLGISVRSGLSLMDALDMAGRASGRPLMMADARSLRDRVKLGGQLSDGLKTSEYLPGFARRMISAGEQAGELPRMTQIVSRHYDREVEHLSKNIATLVEPVMIAGLAVIVLVVALAIFIPMWDMAAVMR